MSFFPGRTNSYQDMIGFIQKLTYTIDGNEVINIIAERLTELILPGHPISARKKEDNSIYLNYPNYGMNFNDGNQFLLMDFHLTFHTGGQLISKILQQNSNNNNNYEVVGPNNSNIRQHVIKMHDKIHFKFIVNNIIYILPLIQEKNLLKIKPQPYGKTMVKEAIIYTGFINHINQVIYITINVIQEILNNVDTKMLENTRARLLANQKKRQTKILSIKSGGSKEKNKLNYIKKKYLLEYCKKNKLKGYSEYNKKDLINFIKKKLT
jgi:hypothetical protein